jgi:hypothetical protein
MSAISSLSSFSYRPPQNAAFQSQIQRGGTTYGSTGAARGGQTAGSAYCPTCGGGGANAARSTSSAASSYCPTCNRAGGSQSNITSFNNAAATRAVGSQSYQGGGQICVACAYQGR